MFIVGTQYIASLQENDRVTAKKNARAELPIKLFADQAAWAAWLAANHAESPGLWLQHAKKAADLTSVSYAEALDVALC
jgi:uncharacterized protein YdeI (YjbR/CyaY-like superfamily)